MKNKVVKHLKDDMKMFKSEASEDKKLIKSLKINKDDEASEKKANGNPKSKMKIAKVMREFKKGELHSGKGGPVVKKPKQAIAIAISVSKKKRK
ncbi:hypothetical protein UFOVP1478_17 [uncultured Caudovirales phage]|uniref:Uncharacterized protein n=1 Tax=uncultured Caudovirales phage TaxID=2100421 RepID=A0A6J5QJD2_9CAUD|nr:hypothetical protein UFOVP1112_4 [uncultured Caudovirales phage]CAB4204013.1 hypothetical protein UFOVP1385_25 [uncultured Caudovirales phage]CAB4215338.1 hypothetical protein UFOVP1478_17 [uncultured Caudovirales phage]